MSPPSQKAHPQRSPARIRRFRPQPPPSAHELTVRRNRIFASLLEGQSHQAIAAAEGITPRRVREIIDDALMYESADSRHEYVRVQVGGSKGRCG